MSLATRCPACTTTFRLRAEQLAARGGRVRCGQCNHVFDGVTHLVTDTAGGDAFATPAPAPDMQIAVQHTEPPASGTAMAAPAEVAAPEVTELTPVAQQANGNIGPAAPGLSESSPPAPVLREPSADLDAPAPSRNPYASARRDAVIGEGAPFGLGNVAPPPAAAPVPRYRVLWGLLGILALAALAAQGVWRYRTELGVLWPATRPYLEVACEFAGCTLRLPRHADLFAIESSDLQRDPAREDLIVLNAVLRNRAKFPQEFPALELTLTDEASSAVVRRVLKPADYLEPRGLARAEAEGLGAGAEARLSVRFDASKARASGYQLYLFYP
jgi:predicted Zn finger-like uncharacterized protein